MVQGLSKNTLTGVALTNQDKKHEKPEAHTQRKAGTGHPLPHHDTNNDANGKERNTNSRIQTLHIFNCVPSLFLSSDEAQGSRLL